MGKRYRKVEKRLSKWGIMWGRIWGRKVEKG
jgi:hypothetical protein